MTSELSSTRFGWQAALRAAIFLVLLIGASVMLFGTDVIDQPDTDITPAEMATAAKMVSFYAYLLLILSMVRPSWRRMRALRLPAYWGLIVPLLMLEDVPFFLAANFDDLFGLSISSIDGELPLYLMTAAGIVVAMIVARPLAGEQNVRRFGLAGAGVLALAIWIQSGIVLFVGMAKWLGFVKAQLDADIAYYPTFGPMVTVSSWVMTLNPYVCAAFLGLIAWCAVRSRQNGNLLNC